MKVKFIGASKEQVSFGGGDDPRKVCTIGQEYNLDKKNEYECYTMYHLREFPDLEFNSVCFEEMGY